MSESLKLKLVPQSQADESAVDEAIIEKAALGELAFTAGSFADELCIFKNKYLSECNTTLLNGAIRDLRTLVKVLNSHNQ